MPRPRPATSRASTASRSPAARRSARTLTGPSASPGAGRDGRVEPGPAQDRLLAGEQLQAAAAAAGAGGAVRLQGGVAELAGVPVGAPEQLAGDDDAGPDPDLAGDADEVAVAGPVPEPQLAQRGHVGLVLDQDRGERRRHPAVRAARRRGTPLQSRLGARATVPGLLVDQPGHGHAGGRDGQALGPGRGHRGPGQPGQQLDHGRRGRGPGCRRPRRTGRGCAGPGRPRRRPGSRR